MNSDAGDGAATDQYQLTVKLIGTHGTLFSVGKRLFYPNMVAGSPIAKPNRFAAKMVCSNGLESPVELGLGFLNGVAERDRLTIEIKCITESLDVSD